MEDGRLLVGAQVVEQPFHILRRDRISFYARDADEARPEPIGREAQDAEQIPHLLALEQAAQMENGNAQIFQRLRDLIQPVVCAAEDGLVAKDDAARLQFSNARGDAGGLIGRIVERAQFWLRLPDAALGFQGQVRELRRQWHSCGEPTECVQHFLSRSVAQAQLTKLRAGEVRSERSHVGGGRPPKAVDGLASVTNRPELLACASDGLH